LPKQAKSKFTVNQDSHNSNHTKSNTLNLEHSQFTPQEHPGLTRLNMDMDKEERNAYHPVGGQLEHFAAT
jgi:hypothetical protein